MSLPKDDCSVFLPDDGKLSFDEFRAYFSDGVLSGDELQELFHAIDTHKTDAPALGAALLRFVQRFCAWCLVLCTWDSVLDAPRRSTLGARTSTLDASALRRSVHIHRRSALDAWCLDASTLGARTSTLDASALRRSVHIHRRSALDAWCLDASTLGARTSTLDASALDAWRIDASTLGARTSTLDASALRRSVHIHRRSALDAWCLDASTLGARASTLGARTSTLDASALRRSVHAPLGARTSTLDARCTHLDARRFGASTLGARTSTLRRSTLGASTPRRSMHAPQRSVHTPRRSTLRRFDARCTHLDARRFGARRLAHRRLDARCTHLDARRFSASTLGARTLTLRRSTLGASTPRRSTLRRFDVQCTHTMSGFHRCVTCQAKLPASDPHDDCVSCLVPDHAASALADRAYCQLSKLPGGRAYTAARVGAYRQLCYKAQPTGAA
ncbi:UNVERIFIED_CONTAM: hypothetical protein FKN15_043911 [Acipenser sinensis]